MQIKTQKQITILQNKAQKVADQLNEEVVAIAKGIQHIQTQTGVVYQLNAENFDAKKLTLIAKKIGDDLEVTLEESVVVFDNYFNVCGTDLSCLVSLPTEDGGLYHIVADAFFTLEDGTQVVYFYGEQSIVATESSAASTKGNQSFFDVINSNIEIVAIVTAVAVVVASSGGSGGGSDDGDDGDDDNKTLEQPIVQVAEVNATENEAKDENHITVKAELGSKVTITFSANGKTVTKIIESASGNHDKVSALTVDELNTLSDGLISISAVAVKDGVASSAGTGSFTLDTVAPIFDQQPTAINTDINTPITTTIYDAQATDQNGNADEGITYSIKGTNANKFEITANTGVVTYKTMQTSVHIDAITIVATDVAGNESLQNITVAVVNKPTIQVAEVNTTENEAQDENQITIKAEAGSKVTITFSANGKTVIKVIESASGNHDKVSALTVDELNTLGDGLISISAVAVKDGVASSAGTGSFTLDTVAPIFDQQPTAINTDINTPITTTIYDAQATDQNGNADEGITYSIKGTNADKFEITADTGVVTYKTMQTSVHIDAITIVATDVAGNESLQNITVSVVNNPTIQVAEVNATENEAQDENQITIKAEAGSKVTITFSANGKTVIKVIESASGNHDKVSALTVDELNTLGDGLISISAVAVKDGVTSSAGTGSFTLDTVAPIFDQQSTAINMNTHTPIATTIYDAQATDQNGNADEGITYSIKGTNADKFEITADTGVVTYKTIQTSERDDTITIVAADIAGNTVEKVVTVSVKNLMRGFTIDGGNGGYASGWSTSSAGDINGDGLDDLIVSSYLDGTTPDGSRNRSGNSYVVFGKIDETIVDLSAVVSGTGGFVVHGNGGNPGDWSGWSVSSAGDVNGDGLDDLIIGVRNAWGGPKEDREYSGNSYVVFGKTDGTAVNLSAIGTDGFAIEGATDREQNGFSVSSAGDVNGDGLDDLIVASAYFNKAEGRVYVVFGKTDGVTVDLANIGTSGFVIKGEDVQNWWTGRSVSSAGDVNGDGLDDLIISAYYANLEAGKSYVVFGKIDKNDINLLDIVSGTGGFVINGENDGDLSSCSVSSAGDVNGDGLDDLIVGAHKATSNNKAETGKTYVVFGKTDKNAVNLSTIALGTGGFVINGENAGDWSGWSVSSAGDVNGDGLDDLIIGAKKANSGNGKSYVVFGKANEDSVNLSAIVAGTGGFVINGESAEDESGHSVSSAGDVNGDGLDDLIVGAYLVNHSLQEGKGRSYVVFGKTDTAAVHLADVSAGQGIIGHAIDFQGNQSEYSGTSADELFVAGEGDNILIGNGGTDVFNAGAGNDTIIIDSNNLTKLYSNTLSNNLLARVDGGGDIDTLKLSGSNLRLDLTHIDNGRIQDIEVIDLTGSGDNTLILNLNDLLDISSSTNILKVIGNSGDKVDIELNDNAFVQNSASETKDGITYHVYSNANASTAELWIDQGLGVI
ncbi:hypothetical protein THERMOT_1238 [Bathymodiolus thermophilus thioautotrophic gill symbiont]|uniref:beta strand repeat-containing protein n=1 Tax=Bathymodiolus thermophilus thioautotrophic gill symbiont TaxID=2360 RepID=UPI00192BA5AC|nr:FG-GAP-like repeat-containing protein [Bathymodiolus thermophilus thioautotrophic gill symbiont]CAB5500459.1 hypothetical protein THERMOT_1238 [Bathymodiolus thermophilus thioautotrophic gill symbiont]